MIKYNILDTKVSNDIYNAIFISTKARFDTMFVKRYSNNLF